MTLEVVLIDIFSIN